MAKTKTYPTNALTKAARTTQSVVLRELRKAGVKPLQELKAGKQTYRSFDQEAMDYIVAWRAAKDNPVQETTPAAEPGRISAAESIADDLGTVCRMLENMNARQLDALSQTDNGMRHLDRKIDQCQMRLVRLEQTLDSVAAMVKALHDDLGGSAAALVEAARGPADDSPRVQA